MSREGQSYAIKISLTEKFHVEILELLKTGCSLREASWKHGVVGDLTPVRQSLKKYCPELKHLLLSNRCKKKAVTQRKKWNSIFHL